MSGKNGENLMSYYGIQASVDGVDMQLDDIPMNLLKVFPVRSGNQRLTLPAINTAETFYVVLPQPYGGDSYSADIFPDPHSIALSGNQLTYTGSSVRGLNNGIIGAWAIYIYGKRK